MPLNFGFTAYEKPQWEVKLEDLSQRVIDETGLSREKLKQVLEVMYEANVIKWL